MATVDPNPPVQKDVRAEDVWTDEADGQPGSPDTQLVVGRNGVPVSKDASLLDSSYTDGKNKDTEGIYQSPGYSLGAQEDDSTNPTTVVPNTNSGAKVDNYTGTTNGASAAATVVPGDTEFAFGHDTASGNIPYLANQPGAKQPDITSGPDAFFGATQGTPPNTELDTLSFKGGAGVLSPTYGQVSITSGTSNAQFGQANNTAGDLDTTNTSMPTTVAVGNDGSGQVLPTGYDLTQGGDEIAPTVSIDGAYPHLTVGKGVTAPGKPTGVSWKFESGSAVVTWTAPVIAAPVQADTVVTTSDSGVFGSTGTYYYVVTATNNVGETVVSNEKTAVIAATTSSATISWAAVTGATGYKVYRGTSAGAENKLIATITSGATVSYKDHGAAGTTATLPVANTALDNGGGRIREYIVQGWRVADAAHIPADTSHADAYITNGVPPTVTGHSHGLTRYKADGTTTSLEPATELRIEHLTPGDFYFFRVAARNEVATSALSALGAVSGSQTSPDYFLDAQKLDGTRVLVPNTSDLPEGESLSELTFTNTESTDETGTAYTGEVASELAQAGEEEDDRI